MKTVKYLVAILILSMSSRVVAEDAVNFADANLKAAVEVQLGVSDPLPETMLGLTSLYAQQAAISDLTGIEHAHNLRELHLWENQIRDISALAQLTQLTVLYLWSNQIEDVSPLSELSDLAVLALPDNLIQDVSALSGLTNLTQLYLYLNRITDIAALSGMTNLEELYLYANQITDVAPLSGLTKLTTLELGANQINDISSLAGLSNLSTLFLWENQIQDVSDLAGLIHLQELYLHANQITDLAPLSGLIDLTTLHLWENQISDVSPLSNMIQLTELDLHDNQVQNVSPLSGLTHLQTLYLYSNQIGDVTALSGLSQLTSLDLADNQLTDIKALTGLTDLKILELGDNQIKETSALSNLANLEELYLYVNQITDITALSGLSTLMYLDLGDNLIMDLAPLSGLENLIELELGGNQLSDIAPLAELANWERLSLQGNPLGTNAYCADLYAITSPTGYAEYDPNPKPPGNVTVSQGLPANALKIAWDAVCNGPSYSTYYQVYRADSPDGVKTAISDWRAETEFVDAPAEAGVSYTYWVRAATNEQGSFGLTDYGLPASGQLGYVDLYDSGESQHGFVPRTLSPGQEIEIFTRIENGGTKNAGAAVLDVFLSSDTVIDSADHALGQVDIGTMAPGAAYDIRGSATLPESLAPGQYYVGWIIDPDNDVTESNENNNQAYVEGYQLTVSAAPTPEPTPVPTPNPMTWAIAPYAINENSVSMSATQATHGSGVEYLFDCLTEGGHDSAWQPSPNYTDSGLQPGTQYTYRVKARDMGQQNETEWSAQRSATTELAPDITAPTPNPLSWATVPHATGQTSIAMTATTATDASGVEYFFDCITPGGHDSGWQASSTYEDTGLSPNTLYQYRVLARDSLDNQTDPSDSASVRTDAPAQGTVRNEATGLWYDSIQQAIDAAGAGHTIRVYPGVHLGPVNFKGKVITLSSTDPQDWTVVEKTVLDAKGAAACVTLNSSAVLEGLTITGCQDRDSRGGAIRCTADTPTIRRCIIRDNQSRSSAALSSAGFASALVENCKFLNNSAVDYGGALSGDLHIIGCEFYGNHAGLGGGAINACTSVSACTFVNNTAGRQGGALRSRQSDLTITDCSFFGNSAREGGAVYAQNPLITNCIIQDNTATQTGGGLYTTQATVITGCAILGNHAQAGHGGGIYHSQNRISLVNCTIRNCAAPLGSGGAIYSDHSLGIKNTILWGNRAATHDQVGGTGEYFYERVHLHSCVIENGRMPFHVIDGAGQVIGLNMGGNFVFTDPLFMDSWHLMQNSPCLDQGQIDPALPATDRDGNARLIGTAVDIGADEIAPDTAVPIPNPLGWWERVPEASGMDTIVMRAAEATGTHRPIEYYFECYQDAAFDSIWQTDRLYEAQGLHPSTEYQFRVKARNRLGNETAFSAWRAATTDAYVDQDVLPPAPNPLTWASAPQAAGLTSITMTASTALDVSGVEYLFQCTAGPGNDSAWQRSPVYTDTGLQANTEYRYRVRTRDMSANQNLGAWSIDASAHTPSQAGLHGIDIYIRSTVDDAEELSGGRMDFAGSELELVNSSTDQVVGLRFTNVDVPAHAQVVNAHILFHVGGIDSGPCTLTIRAHDTDSADDFSAFAGLSSLPTTSAGVTWSPSPWTSMGAKKQTPDLKSIVQALVNRSGWRQGNDMVLIIRGSGRRVAKSYDNGSYLSGPLLHIDYE